MIVVESLGRHVCSIDCQRSQTSENGTRWRNIQSEAAGLEADERYVGCLDPEICFDLEVIRRSSAGRQDPLRG